MHVRAGFTLLEIMLAVAIGLLVLLIAVPSISGVLEERRLHAAMESFDHGNLPGFGRAGIHLGATRGDGSEAARGLDFLAERRVRAGAGDLQGTGGLLESAVRCAHHPPYRAGRKPAMIARSLHLRRRGFMLFESLLAVTIFTIAVLALAKCVNNCMRAEMQMREDDRARRALENRMAEIEAGAVQVSDEKSEDLKSPFDGMTITQSRKALKWKNEKEEDIPGLYEMNLKLTWDYRGEKSERTLLFYVAPRQR
jgi:prepilin-type N-terminal cleavage/methylation domain-containing protein